MSNSDEYGIFWFFGFVILILLFYYIKSRKTNEETYEEIEEPEPIDISTPQVKLTESYLTLENYIGQTKNINYLNGHINRAKIQDKALPHIVLWGIGGLGKSTLIKAVAYGISGRFLEIVPANLRTINDLFNILLWKTCPCGRINPYTIARCLNCKDSLKIYFTPLVKLQDKDIVFFEECHGLKADIEEALYSLMQDNYMIIRYDGMDRRVDFPNITIAGATTRLGDLNKPFRDRFKIIIKLRHYEKEEIKTISKMYCSHKGYNIADNALDEIAEISYGIPRIAKKYLDDSITRGSEIGIKEVDEILNLLEIDKNGLDRTHRDIINYIHIRGSAGDTAISSSVGLPKSIYLEVYEPALFYKEFIYQGPRGRELTKNVKEIYFKDCECKKCNK